MEKSLNLCAFAVFVLQICRVKPVKKIFRICSDPFLGFVESFCFYVSINGRDSDFSRFRGFEGVIQQASALVPSHGAIGAFVGFAERWQA